MSLRCSWVPRKIARLRPIETRLAVTHGRVSKIAGQLWPECAGERELAIIATQLDAMAHTLLVMEPTLRAYNDNHRGTRGKLRAPRYEVGHGG